MRLHHLHWTYVCFHIWGIHARFGIMKWKNSNCFASHSSFVSIANVKRDNTVVCAVHRAHSIGSHWHNLTQIHTAFQRTGSVPMKCRHTAVASIQWFVLNNLREKTDLCYELVRNIDCRVIVQWNFLREFRLKMELKGVRVSRNDKYSCT